ncbi:hypothetical protein EYF80_038155 [Liparis tanakae]|uniref:Uncharacterized protein n=1 Tax=Liparis tanakae TaxID=230148 RepID=A0A4Z2GE52_9TELE|nr:hypothetical protein EYF80_038155 [Liparis tanakae]
MLDWVGGGGGGGIVAARQYERGRRPRSIPPAARVGVRAEDPAKPRRAPQPVVDAQLSRCSWPTDKWEKIVQFELVVSSRSAAFQINERLPQVWQEIFLKHSWETGPYHCNPLAMPSIRQARHHGREFLKPSQHDLVMIAHVL